MNRHRWGLVLGVCLGFLAVSESAPVAAQEAPADEAAVVGARLQRVIQGMLDGKLPAEDVVERLRTTRIHQEPVSFGPVESVRFVEAGEQRSYTFEAQHENTKAQWTVWLEPESGLIANLGWKRLSPPDASIQPGVFETVDPSGIVALTQKGDSIWVGTDTGRLEYRRQPDGDFHYVADGMYRLRIIDPLTVERYAAGGLGAAERLSRRNGAAAQPTELVEGYFTYEQFPELVAYFALVGDALVTSDRFGSFVAEYGRLKNRTYAHSGGWARVVDPYTVEIINKTSSGAPDPNGPQRLFRSRDVAPDFLAVARERDRRTRQQRAAEEARYQASQRSESSGDAFGAALLGAIGAYAGATADNEQMRRSLDQAAEVRVGRGATEAARGYAGDGPATTAGAQQGARLPEPAPAMEQCRTVTKTYSRRSLPKPSVAEAEGYIAQFTSACHMGAQPSMGPARCTESSEPLVTKDAQGIPRVTGRQTLFTCEVELTCPAREVCEGESTGASAQ